MERTHGLIFDFDGTIADSLFMILSTVNRLSSELGVHSIPEGGKELWREKGAKEVLHELGIPIWRVPFIMRRVREELALHMERVNPIPGVVPVLEELHRAGMPLGILTSNSVPNVEEFLRRHTIDFFDYIYSENRLFGKGKILRHLLKKKALDPHQVFYVGDETRDVEAAKKSDVPVIAVTWGFNSEAALRKHSPDYIVRAPQDLLPLVL